MKDFKCDKKLSVMRIEKQVTKAFGKFCRRVKYTIKDSTWAGELNISHYYTFLHNTDLIQVCGISGKKTC